MGGLGCGGAGAGAEVEAGAAVEELVVVEEGWVEWRFDMVVMVAERLSY